MCRWFIKRSNPCFYLLLVFGREFQLLLGLFSSWRYFRLPRFPLRKLASLQPLHWHDFPYALPTAYTCSDCALATDAPATVFEEPVGSPQYTLPSKTHISINRLHHAYRSPPLLLRPDMKYSHCAVFPAASVLDCILLQTFRALHNVAVKDWIV